MQVNNYGYFLLTCCTWTCYRWTIQNCHGTNSCGKKRERPEVTISSKFMMLLHRLSLKCLETCHVEAIQESCYGGMHLHCGANKTFLVDWKFGALLCWYCSVLWSWWQRHSLKINLNNYAELELSSLANLVSARAYKEERACNSIRQQCYYS
jgi:hypothetical protein